MSARARAFAAPLITSLLIGLSATVQARAWTTPCPNQPGVLSQGELSFLKDASTHMRDVESRACVTVNGLDCKLVEWSKAQAAVYPNCAKFFMDENGQVGALGKLVTQEVESDIQANGTASAYMRDYPDLEADNVCPGFRDMSPAEKAFFWSWFFEILGHFESSCDPALVDRSPNVPNGPAIGLYQMEERPSLRSWRGPNCQVSAAAIHTPEGNTACATDILKNLLLKNDGIFGTTGTRRAPGKPTYWWALKPGNDVNLRFRRYLPRFPLCKPTAPPPSEPLRVPRSRARSAKRARAPAKPSSL